MSVTQLEIRALPVGIDIWKASILDLKEIVKKHKDTEHCDELSKGIYEWFGRSIVQLDSSGDLNELACRIIPDLQSILTKKEDSLPYSKVLLDRNFDVWDEADLKLYTSTGLCISPIDGKEMVMTEHSLANDIINWLQKVPNTKTQIVPKDSETVIKALRVACQVLKGSGAMVKASFGAMREELERTYQQGVQENKQLALDLKGQRIEAAKQQVADKAAVMARLNQLEATYKGMQTELAKQQACSQEATSQLAQVAVEVPQLKKEISGLKGSVSKLENEVSWLKEELDDAEGWCSIM